jgi:hypothetical protein
MQNKLHRVIHQINQHPYKDNVKCLLCGKKLKKSLGGIRNYFDDLGRLIQVSLHDQVVVAHKKCRKEGRRKLIKLIKKRRMEALRILRKNQKASSN